MKLKIAENLALPIDVVTQTIAVLAKRRAGKSYTMRRIVEQLFKAGQQVVLVDPKGDQWGVRSAADGKGPGLPIVILGGEREDVRLEAGAGEIVAKLVVEERVSALLDLSLFRKHEVATFMTGFMEALYRLKAREIYRTPMMLVIDEADAIAPQKPQKGEERMLGAAEDLVRRGGQRGIGCVLVSQRSAVLNKNVLMSALHTKMAEEATAILKVLRVVTVTPPIPPATIHHMPVRAARPVSPPGRPARELAESNGNLTGPEQRIVDAIAWLEQLGITEPEQPAVAFLANYRYGGGAFNNPRGALRVKGYVEYLAGDRIRLTEDGRKAARYPDVVLTNDELQRRVLARLPGPEQRVLLPLLRSYPKPMANEDLAEAANYEAGGGSFNNPKGRLRTLGLIDYPTTRVRRGARSALSGEPLMGQNTAIEWCSHTFNPWRGCTKVSAGCVHCYAEVGSKRNPKVLGVWGDDGTRVVGVEAYWREPVRWNREAVAAGKRRRVFCASLADVGEDRPDLVAPRARLCEVIDATPALVWMLLTKRPENIARLFPEAILRKCVVGTTTENQPMYDRRIGTLLRTPALHHFISAEPLLGPIDLRLGGMAISDYAPLNPLPKLGQVIVGGESGPHARPMHPDWARALRDQCVAAGVPFFFKQWGEWAPGENAEFTPTRSERTATWFNDAWHFSGLTPIASRDLHRDDEPDLYWLGKKRAGRLLDGREWNEFPRRDVA